MKRSLVLITCLLSAAICHAGGNDEEKGLAHIWVGIDKEGKSKILTEQPYPITDDVYELQVNNPNLVGRALNKVGNRVAKKYACSGLGAGFLIGMVVMRIFFAYQTE